MENNIEYLKCVVFLVKGLTKPSLFDMFRRAVSNLDHLGLVTLL